MKKPVIAVFDFDETLIIKDTLIDFLRFSNPPMRFYWLMFLSSPVLIAYLLKITPNYQAKQKVLKLFWGGIKCDEFDKKCQAYSARLDSISNPEGIKCVKAHKKSGNKVVICSASAEDWIMPWAKSYGIDDVIATRLQKIDGRITGKISGANCFGAEKVNRFLAEFPDRKSYILYAYGDGKSDAQIFEIADKVYKKTF